jgi:FkbM family methyltransferase
VNIRGVSFTLPCDNRITDFRWRTYATKEPETLDWIDGLEDGDVLFDVGANIGLYSLYAARRHPGMRIVAFEPEYANLHLLRDNIVLNGLGDRIEPYALALGDRSGLSRLHLSDFTPGAALHTEDVGRPAPVHPAQAVVGTEGICVMRMDDFCEAHGMTPTAIKIDVDGNEHRVLEGARRMLALPTLRSVLIEQPADHAERNACMEHLGKAGLQPLGRFGTANEVWRRPGADGMRRS